MAHPLPIETLESVLEPVWAQDDRLDTFPRGAPAPPNPLIGREHELALLHQLFASGGARLVTLTGPGGVGKTRLALALAASIRETLVDTVAFVPLAAVQEPMLVAAAIADRPTSRRAAGGHSSRT